MHYVALRKESVDRNTIALAVLSMYSVALRKESVDRNNAVQIVIVVMNASLSARRAWIEIRRCVLSGECCWSLSARRAWIEMALLELIPLSDPPSLSARRAWIEIQKFLKKY